MVDVRVLLRAALLRGVPVAVAIALAVALFVTVWELIENPGGIFRSDAGWRWDFLAETFFSWLLPTFLGLAPVSVVAAVALAWWRARRA